MPFQETSGRFRGVVPHFGTGPTARQNRISFDRGPQNASVAVEWLSRWNVYRHSLSKIPLTSFGHAGSISTGC